MWMWVCPKIATPRRTKNWILMGLHDIFLHLSMKLMPKTGGCSGVSASMSWKWAKASRCRPCFQRVNARACGCSTEVNRTIPTMPKWQLSGNRKKWNFHEFQHLNMEYSEYSLWLYFIWYSGSFCDLRGLPQHSKISSFPLYHPKKPHFNPINCQWPLMILRNLPYSTIKKHINWYPGTLLEGLEAPSGKQRPGILGESFVRKIDPRYQV